MFKFSEIDANAICTVFSFPYFSFEYNVNKLCSYGLLQCIPSALKNQHFNEKNFDNEHIVVIEMKYPPPCSRLNLGTVS